MDDLISREAAIAAIDKEREILIEQGRLGAEHVVAHHALRQIDELPAVDAVPVVHGRWVKMTGMMPPEYHGHYECSECQWHMKGLRNSWTREEELSFCPSCGAKMDGQLAAENSGKVGTWDSLGHRMGYLKHPWSKDYLCSLCGYEAYTVLDGPPEICPGCGAKMVGEQSENNEPTQEPTQ